MPAPTIDIGLFSHNAVVVHPDQVQANRELAVTGLTAPDGLSLSANQAIRAKILPLGSAQAIVLDVFTTSDPNYWAVFVEACKLKPGPHRLFVYHEGVPNGGKDVQYFVVN